MNKEGHHIKTLLFIFTLFIFHPCSFCQSGITRTIYFKPASSSISKKYETVLNKIAKEISSDSSCYIKIFGFADTKGAENYNERLSKERAEEVCNYLASKTKIDTTHLYIEWFGESEDIYDLHFPGAHKQQRCVDIWIQFYRKKISEQN